MKILDEHGFHKSCSKKANPYDNAWTESFMKTLKYDEVHMREYETYLDVVENLPRFIEEVYNKIRLHSSLNYLPPEEFESKFANEFNVNRPTFHLEALSLQQNARTPHATKEIASDQLIEKRSST